jgi:hypothetical protein
MKGKLVWFESVTVVDLCSCDQYDASSVLAELGSMPSLRILELPAICAERAVDADRGGVWAHHAHHAGLLGRG